MHRQADQVLCQRLGVWKAARPESKVAIDRLEMDWRDVQHCRSQSPAVGARRGSGRGSAGERRNCARHGSRHPVPRAPADLGWQPVVRCTGRQCLSAVAHSSRRESFAPTTAAWRGSIFRLCPQSRDRTGVRLPFGYRRLSLPGIQPVSLQQPHSLSELGIARRHHATITDSAHDLPRCERKEGGIRQRPAGAPRYVAPRARVASSMTANP